MDQVEGMCVAEKRDRKIGSKEDVKTERERETERDERWGEMREDCKASVPSRCKRTNFMQV